VKKVLVTGAAGFVGHHIVQSILEETDWDIICLDRLDTSGMLNRIEDILSRQQAYRSRVQFVWHDLKAPLNEMIQKAVGYCDYILHLAAGSHVDRSIQDPMSFIMDNVVGTCNILDFARLYLKDRLKKFVYFSTDEVFGPAPEGVAYKEWDRYNSGNPYSASKASAEELCLAYANTYGMPIMITHCMNIFGIRQHPEKYIPMVIRKVLESKKVFVHANKDCTQAGKRFYVNTADVADAVFFILEHGVRGEKYNIVGERELDNLELAQMIAEIIGKPLVYEMVDFHSSRPGHDLRYALDGAKMKEMGWVPKKKVKDRLIEVVNWTLENPYWM
jgi:dTDP-glucose 4,6-dehydratase